MRGTVDFFCLSAKYRLRSMKLFLLDNGGVHNFLYFSGWLSSSTRLVYLLRETFVNASRRITQVWDHGLRLFGIRKLYCSAQKELGEAASRESVHFMDSASHENSKIFDTEAVSDIWKYFLAWESVFVRENSGIFPCYAADVLLMSYAYTQYVGEFTGEVICLWAWRAFGLMEM